MIGAFGGRAGDDPARSSRIKAWVAAAFALQEGTAVMVTELTCTEPGCPPIETVVAILDGPGRTRRYKVHKPIADVTEPDVTALAIHPHDTSPELPPETRA